VGPYLFQDLVFNKHAMNETRRADDAPLVIMRVNPLWVEY
jgi:hypothetical protein